VPGFRICWRSVLLVSGYSEDLMISIENLIGLIGGVALVIYLFVALTHPEKF
jgi:K+-transporting ATPase KdpF subunit